jgi:hypothetical protein
MSESDQGDLKISDRGNLVRWVLKDGMTGKYFYDNLTNSSTSKDHIVRCLNALYTEAEKAQKITVGNPKEGFIGDLELIRAKMFYMKIADFSIDQLDSLIDMIEELKQKYKEMV